MTTASYTVEATVPRAPAMRSLRKSKNWLL